MVLGGNTWYLCHIPHVGHHRHLHRAHAVHAAPLPRRLCAPAAVAVRRRHPRGRRPQAVRGHATLGRLCGAPRPAVRGVRVQSERTTAAAVGRHRCGCVALDVAAGDGDGGGHRPVRHVAGVRVRVARRARDADVPGLSGHRLYVAGRMGDDERVAGGCGRVRRVRQLGVRSVRAGGGVRPPIARCPAGRRSERAGRHVGWHGWTAQGRPGRGCGLRAPDGWWGGRGAPTAGVLAQFADVVSGGGRVSLSGRTVS